jgi:hypothetical protein
MIIESLVFPRKEGCILHPDDPYGCDDNVLNTDYLKRLQEYHNTVDNVHDYYCSRPQLLNKIVTASTGLCAPTTVTVQRKVKGYICKSILNGLYYLEPKKGQVYMKEHAHVYSCEEAKQAAIDNPGWGGKAEGKWIVVYA